MENASKALIIAGAILISILLISVGIIVMNAINDPVQQGADSAKTQAVEIFNSKFTGYAGKQTYTTIKALYAAFGSLGAQKHGAKIDPSTMNPAWKNSDPFTVSITYQPSGENAGYIDTIKVEQK